MDGVGGSDNPNVHFWWWESDIIITLLTKRDPSPRLWSRVQRTVRVCRSFTVTDLNLGPDRHRCHVRKLVEKPTPPTTKQNTKHGGTFLNISSDLNTRFTVHENIYYMYVIYYKRNVSRTSTQKNNRSKVSLLSTSKFGTLVTGSGVRLVYSRNLGFGRTRRPFVRTTESPVARAASESL